MVSMFHQGYSSGRLIGPPSLYVVVLVVVGRGILQSVMMTFFLYSFILSLNDPIAVLIKARKVGGGVYWVGGMWHDKIALIS